MILQRLRRSSLAGLILFGLYLGGDQGYAKSEAFSHVAVFGDSLSDTGNFYSLTGGYPPAPNYLGRFCNGPLWVEYLSTALGMDYQAADNFAVAGATTGTSNSNDPLGREFPGLQDEITSFIAAGGVTEPDRALYVVGAGANDFFVGLESGTPPGTIIANGVANTLLAVQRLRSVGARFIMVMDVPDLGVTPYALATGNGAGITQLCAVYNQQLSYALDQLAAAGIPTIRLDAFAVLDRMAKTPADYGFENVTEPLKTAGTGATADLYLFWDAVHPTTKAHKVLAEEAVQDLMKFFSPSKGRGSPKGEPNSLHGLVNAALHRG